MRILGKEFIKKNKDKGMILYNNTEFELNEYFDDIDNLNKSLLILYYAWIKVLMILVIYFMVVIL